MKTTFWVKLKSMSLAKKIVLIMLIAAVISGAVVGAVLIANKLNAPSEQTEVVLTFYDENRAASEQITVPFGSTVNADAIPKFSKDGHYLAAWSYVDHPTKYLKATDEMKENAEFIAVFLKEEQLYESSQYLYDVGEDIEFTVSSTIALTDDNLVRYIEFKTLSGLKNSIKAIDNGNGTYTIRPMITYLPGETYSIRIVDDELMYFSFVNGQDVSADKIRKYSFSIKDESYSKIKYSSEIVDIASSKLLGMEENVAYGTETLSAMYFDSDVALKPNDIIRIKSGKDSDDAFRKIISIGIVENATSQYNGKIRAVVSVPKGSEYLDEYEVKVVGLYEENVVSEEMPSDEELMDIIYNALTSSEEYAVAMDTLLYAAKQTPSVQSVVAKLSSKEQQDFANVNYKQMANKSMKDLNLKASMQAVREGGWYGYKIEVSATPEFDVGQKGKIKVGLSTILTIKVNASSTSFYVQEKTGYKVDGNWFQSLFHDWWEYDTSTIRTCFDTEVKFNITFELADGEEDEGFDLNEDISEQVSNLLDFILDEENESGENETARKLLDQYLANLDYELITGDLDYISLFEVPLGKITFNLYGIDITVRFDFIVSAGLRCGMTASFKYHVENEEVSSNGERYYMGENIEEVSVYDLAYRDACELAYQDTGEKKPTDDQIIEARRNILNHIQYKQVEESKKATTLCERISFDLTVGGKAGLRAGVKVSVRLSGFFLDDWAYIGASVELGAYTELTAYVTFHLERETQYGFGSTNKRLTGAVKLETGFYITFDIEWKFFWYESSYNIVDKQWPLFTISTTPSIYDFAKSGENVSAIGRQVNLKDFVKEKENKNLLDICYVDVFENSIENKPATNQDIDKMKFRMVSYYVTDPSDGADVTDRYTITISDQSLLDVYDKRSWEAPRDTDVATIVIYVGMSSETNFLTGDPVGKTFTLTLPLGEIIDLEHQYTIRFFDQAGNIMTHQNGDEMIYKLYGNELPKKYPDSGAIHTYLYNAFPGVSENQDSPWANAEGNLVKIEKATKDMDYYLVINAKANLVRYTYYDRVSEEYKHIDQYLVKGEVAKEPDISTLGSGGEGITGWDVSPQNVTLVEIQNYNVNGIHFAERYKSYSVNTEYYLEVFAKYDDLYSDIVWKFGDEELRRTSVGYGSKLSDEVIYRNPIYMTYIKNGLRGEKIGGLLNVPNFPNTYKYRDGKLYSMTVENIDSILNDPVFKELQTKGAWKEEYVIEFPGTEVEYDGNVTVKIIANPKKLYPTLNQYQPLYMRTVKYGSTLTEDILPLSDIKYNDKTLQVIVPDLQLPYVVDDLTDSHIYVDIVDGKAQISLCYYVDEIMDKDEGRRTFVILDANGGRFGTLPNDGTFAYDIDFIVPGTERFTTIEYRGLPVVSYNDIVEHSEYAVPVKFGARFVGWSTTSDGSNRIGVDSKLNPGVGDATEIKLYAVYEAEKLVKINLASVDTFTLAGTEYPCSITVMYLAYEDGTPPQLPIVAIREDETRYLDGWAYMYGSPLTALPQNPTGEGNIEIEPVIKYYPIVRYQLPYPELSFAEQTGFRLDGNNKVARAYVKDINRIQIPNTPTHALRSFAGWRIDNGEVLSNEQLATEVKRLINGGELSIDVLAVYTPHSSSFSIAENCDGAFAVTPNASYVVAVGKTFAESGIPIPSKPEYTFDYWTVDSDNKMYYLTDEIPQGMDNYILSAVFIWDYENVIFDANGGVFADGETAKTVKSKLGEPLLDVPTPTREGYYIFAGWARTANGTPFDIDRFTCSKGLELYAIWESVTPQKVTYAIGTAGNVFAETSGFEYSNGMTKASATITFDAVNHQPTITENDDYSFIGWSTTEQEADLLPTEQINAYLLEKAKQSRDVTLYAIFRKNYANIIFNANNGSFDGLNDTVSVVARVGNRIKTTLTPVRLGYSHDGWSLSADGTAVDMETYLCTENTVLYAIWSAKPIKNVIYWIGEVPTAFVETAGFDYSEGTKKATAQIVFDHVNEIPDIVEHKEYSFLGWSTNSDGTGMIEDTELDSYLKVTADAGKDAVLYAMFKAYPKVSFHLNDGKSFEQQSGFDYSNSNATARMYVSDMDDILIPNVPQNALQSFVGWQIEGGESLFDTAVLQSELKRLLQSGSLEVDVYAVYRYHSAVFRIADADGGKFDVTLKDEYIVPYHITFGASEIPVPSKDEYVFLGWKLSQDGERIYSLSDTVPDGLSSYELYAVFKWNCENVIFDANGGEFEDATSSTSIKFVLGEAITGVPVPTRSGYVFSGWSLTSEGTAVNMSTLTCREGLKLYALWTVKPSKTVTYVLGTSENTFVDQAGYSYSDDKKEATATIATNEENILPIITEHYAFGFVGWSTTGEEKDIIGLQEIDGYLKECANADHTVILYAVFKAYPKVNFHLTDGKTFSVQSEFGYTNGNATAWVYVSDIDDILIPNAPQDALQSFVGWRIGADAPLDETALRSAITLLLQNGADAIDAYATYEAHSSSFRIADADGGSFDVPLNESYIVAHGALFGESDIPVPSKNGYIFLGWRLSKDGTQSPLYTLNDRIPEDMLYYDLYAVFKSDSADVTFDANGGSYSDASTIKTVTTKLGEPVLEAPTPTREGYYAFIGWARTANGDVLNMSEVYCTEGLVLYAVWEDRSPKTVYFDAGDGRFANGFKLSEAQISYPYAFSSELIPTYTGAGNGEYGFAYWVKADGTEIDATYTVSDGETFTAMYWRTDVHATFRDVIFQYNEVSGTIDAELGWITYDGFEEGEQIDVYSEQGTIPYPAYTDFTVPVGYEKMFVIPIDVLTERGMAKLKNAGAKIYVNEYQAYMTLTTELTTDMLIIEEDYWIMISLCVVPTDGPDERVRFDEYLYYDVGYGIISSEYDTMIDYQNGGSVPLDASGNIVVPEHTIGQQLAEGQMKLVLIEAEYLTDVGIEALRAKNARVYASSDGFYTYYEVNIPMTRDMVKIELQPKFIIAYIPQDSIGVHAAMFIKLVGTDIFGEPNKLTTNANYYISYSGGIDTISSYLIPYNESSELVLPLYTISNDFTVEDGMKLAFLVDSRALTDDAVAMFKQSGAGEYIVDYGVFYELNIMLTQNMVKIGMAPDICLGYIPAE